MKVVGYTSLETQVKDPATEELLLLQNKFIKDYCQEKSFELLYIFFDSENNNDFTAKNWLNLEDYIRVEKVVHIISLSPDRICKNSRLLKYKKIELSNLGTTLVYLDELSQRDLYAIV